MRNHSLLLWVLLFVDGVFVAVTDELMTVSVSVSVMEGDSVTLNTGISNLNSDDGIDWMLGDNMIARINEADGIFDTYDGSDGRFRDRLKLDKQTGSLTITNIRVEDSEIYKLVIKRENEKFKTFRVTVNVIVELLSVMEGDTVTLHTGVTGIQRDGHILWKSGDQGGLIADLNSAVDPAWSNIHLRNQTGELTFRNIRIKQSGVYKVEINTINMILHRKFKITVEGAKKVLVMAKETIALHTGVLDIKGYDLILWKFEDHIMAEINKGTNQFLLHNSSYVRFNGRLDLHRETGDLIIRSIRTTDAGDYHLKMSNSTYTFQRAISVTVSDQHTPDPGPHTNYEALICGIVLGLVLLAAFALLIYYRRKISKLISQSSSNHRVQSDFAEVELNQNQDE